MSDAAAEADCDTGVARGEGHIAVIVARAHVGAEADIDVGADAAVGGRNCQSAAIGAIACSADLKASGGCDGQIGLEVAANNSDTLWVGSIAASGRTEAYQAGGRHREISVRAGHFLGDDHLGVGRKRIGCH